MDYPAATVPHQEKKVMNVPHNYYEWIKLSELFKNKIDDDEPLAAMKAGTIQSLKTNMGRVRSIQRSRRRIPSHVLCS